MAEYKYPQNDLDRPSQLLNTVGSYWATTYLGMDFLEDVLKAKANLTSQTWINFMELIASISRFSVPVFHRQNWQAVAVKQSAVNNSTASIPDYEQDTSNVYSSTTSQEYGKPLAIKGYFSIEIPGDVARVKNVLSNIANPGVIWTESVDYWKQKDGLLVFRENPFDNENFPVRDIFKDGEIVDKEIVLWLYSGEVDLDNVYEQFGYALELKMQSSEGYRDIINAVLDAFTGGTKSKDLQYAWSAITDVPIVLSEQETVELVTEDSRSTVIVTDKNAYTFKKGSTPLVAAGDVVYAGESLVDTFQIYEFNRGTIPSAVSGLVIGPGFLSLGFFGELTFENKTTPLIVEEDVDGYTKVSWDLGGFSEDVTKFWNDVHTKGVQEGKTLAMYLDVRPEPVGQPTAANLPENVNPLEFLTENFLRYNTFLVKVSAGKLGKDKLPFIPASSLRKIVPPQTAMLVLVELETLSDTVVMDGPPSATEPGYTEELSFFPCMVVSETVLAADYVSENIRLRQISGRCQ